MSVVYCSQAVTGTILQNSCGLPAAESAVGLRPLQRPVIFRVRRFKFRRCRYCRRRPSAASMPRSHSPVVMAAVWRSWAHPDRAACCRAGRVRFRWRRGSCGGGGCGGRVRQSNRRRLHQSSILLRHYGRRGIAWGRGDNSLQEPILRIAAILSSRGDQATSRSPGQGTGPGRLLQQWRAKRRKRGARWLQQGGEDSEVG